MRAWARSIAFRSVSASASFRRLVSSAARSAGPGAALGLLRVSTIPGGEKTRHGGPVGRDDDVDTGDVASLLELIASLAASCAATEHPGGDRGSCDDLRPSCATPTGAASGRRP